MINQTQATAINGALSNFVCPICGCKHFTIFPEKQQLIWNNNGSPTNTKSENALRVIAAVCDQCKYILTFRTDD